MTEHNFQAHFSRAILSGVRGPNSTTFGGDIGPLKALNNFVLNFRYVALFQNQIHLRANFRIFIDPSL